MTIKKAREILGEKYDRLSDEEIQGMIDSLTTLAHIAIDTIMEMPPDQKEKYLKKNKKTEAG